jgi:hypothetical protein
MIVMTLDANDIITLVSYLLALVLSAGYQKESSQEMYRDVH